MAENVQVNITCRKELMEMVKELKKRGVRVSGALALILGRWTEKYSTSKEAAEAAMSLFDDYPDPDGVQ